MISASVGEIVRPYVCDANHVSFTCELLIVSRPLQTACLIRVPTEVIKTRSQTSTYGALADSSLAAARLLWRTEGLKGFYRGFGITVMREVGVVTVFK